MKIENLWLTGPAGKLEAILEYDPQATPCWAALVCHPHPQHGGTMHNKVVFRAAKAATRAGIPALRFNFRGAGRSEGQFAEGPGEKADVRAALDYLAKRFKEARICLMGFSFGAWVGLEAGAEDGRVAALAGLGLPVASVNMDFLRAVTKPKLIIQGTEDAFGPREKVEILYQSLPEPKRIHWVQGADHFFTGRLEEVQAALSAFIEEIVGRSSRDISRE